MLAILNILSCDKLLQVFVFSFRSIIQDSGGSLVNGVVKFSLTFFIRCGLSRVIFSIHNYYTCNSSSYV